MTLLALEDVSIFYRRGRAQLPAMRNVSLTLEADETLGLVGESGSGKSSLAAAILGLMPAGARIEGAIRFAGADMARMAPEALRRLRGRELAAIGQDPFTALNPVVRIGRQLVAFQHWQADRSRAERRRRAVEMLAEVGLSDAEARMRQFPHQLSGGIRQRVAIAAALLTRPRLLIADEPTTALDATTEAQILEIIRRARASLDGGVVFITHDIGAVARLCDRVAVLYAGELVETGPVPAVLAAPRHPYTKALLACDPARIATATRRLPTIPGIVPPPDALPAGCVFAPRCPEAFPRCSAERPPPLPTPAGGVSACHLEAA